jgi:hypothetical protein
VAEVDGVEPDAEAVLAVEAGLDADADRLADGLADEVEVVVRLPASVTLSPGVPRSWAS